MAKIPQSMLTKLASKSTHPKYWHSAVVIKGGAILSIGYNHDGRHAEVVALSKLWPNKRKGTTVFSFRMGLSGEPQMAKPCKDCQGFLLANGVKKVYFTTRDGAVGMDLLRHNIEIA